MSRKRNRGDYNRPWYSGISDHKRVGKELQPPFAQIQGRMASSSWLHEQMPEMLWAVLLISGFSRDDALESFRRIAKCAEIFRDKKEITVGITQSDLATIEKGAFNCIVEAITRHPTGSDTLRPLLLFEKLPGYDRWKKSLQIVAKDTDWETLSNAVRKTLNHQSQESTDCRWATILFQIAAGKVIFNKSLEEQAKQIIYYPNYGDMKRVRPSIRAMEMTYRIQGKKSIWSNDFWEDCFKNTPCLRGDPETKTFSATAGTTRDRLASVREALEKHCGRSATTTAVDASHDTTFGFCFYSLSVLEELLRLANSQAIVGRFALRSLVECYLTLAYLAKNNSDKLWQSYRSYGAGQAKLAFLKLEEESNDLPSFLNREILEALANEDVFQEYLNINLGHWDNLNLRKMAEMVNLKDIYDRYYDWTSSYIHGHWGPMRDVAFSTCFNPLHRLHRIPRREARTLEDVLPDACRVVDGILELLNKLYPSFQGKVTV